jgi:hypothetical protein
MSEKLHNLNNTKLKTFIRNKKKHLTISMAEIGSKLDDQHYQFFKNAINELKLLHEPNAYQTTPPAYYHEYRPSCQECSAEESITIANIIPYLTVLLKIEVPLNIQDFVNFCNKNDIGSIIF